MKYSDPRDPIVCEHCIKNDDDKAWRKCVEFMPIDWNQERKHCPYKMEHALRRGAKNES